MERSTIENKFKWTIDEMYPNEESIEKYTKSKRIN